MTSETRIFVELTDITVIEFGCPHCDTKILYPIDKRDRPPLDDCPNCHEKWFLTGHQSSNSPTSADGVKKAIDGLYSLSQSPFIKARVRLVVKDPEVKN